jgi:hypothetical protein
MGNMTNAMNMAVQLHKTAFRMTGAISSCLISLSSDDAF